MGKHRLSIPTITCASCVSLLNNVFTSDSIPASIKESEVKDEFIVQVQEDGKFEDVLEAIREFHPGAKEIKPNSSKANPNWYLINAIVAGVPSLILLALLLAGVYLAPTIWFVIGLSTLGVMSYSGSHIYRSAQSEFRHLYSTRQLSMDSLFAISASVAWGASMLALFMPTMGLHIMFQVPLMIIGFRNLGIWIKTKSENYVKRGLNLLDVYEGSDCVNIGVGKIKLFKAGEMILLDGTIEKTQADTLIKGTIKSGDTNPKSFALGDEVLAGMIVTSGEVTIKVTKTMKDSYLSKLQKDKQEKAKPQHEKLTETIMNYFIPGTFIIAIISGIVMTHNLGMVVGLSCALSVLVASCPCVLGMIIPLLAYICRNKANDKGVLFVNEKIFQVLSKVDTIVLDKTGTITTGNYNVTALDIFGIDWDETKVWQYVAALEKTSEHPLGKSLFTFASTKIKENKIHGVENLKTYADGVEATINNKKIIIGNARLLKGKGIHVPTNHNRLVDQHSIIYLVENKKIITRMLLSDEIKPGVVETIQYLKEQGIKVVMCTGSDKQYAQAIAAKVGIHEVLAEQAPQAKQTFIEKLQAQGHTVAMVGDNINDILALNKSDVAMVVKSEDENTQRIADVLLEADTFLSLLHAVKVAKQTMANVKQSLVITFAYNLLMIGSAAGVLAPLGFVMNPGLAAGLMIFQSSLVLLNAYWFKQTIISSPKVKLLRETCFVYSPKPIGKENFELFRYNSLPIQNNRMQNATIDSGTMESNCVLLN